MWYLAHFFVAVAFLIIFYFYLRLLATHAVKATKLSTAITDDKETIASRRTVVIRSMALDFTNEEAVKDELKKLMPPEKQSIGDMEILSISLFHDVKPLQKAVAKKAKVLDEIERLEILATQVQHNPGAKIKRAWLRILHAPGALSLQDRLERLRRKKDLCTQRIVDEMWAYYERVTIDEGGNEFTNANAATLRSSCDAAKLSDPQDLLSPKSPKEVELPGESNGKKDEAKQEYRPSSLYLSFTGQAFVSFRASAMAGEVVKRHRETRNQVRLKLNHLGLPTRHNYRRDDFKLTPFQRFCHFFMSRRSRSASEQESDTHRDWNISFAPKPSDILWDNLAVQENLVLNFGRWLVANAGIIALVLFIGIPAMISNQIVLIIKSQTKDLDPERDFNARVTLFFTSYLTSLTMWIVNGFYSPLIMTKALDFEQHATKSSYAASRFFKSSLFLLVNMILLPIFAMTTVSDLIGKVRDQSEVSHWYQIVGNAFFVNSGLYFRQYLVHQVFVNFGFNLLDLPTYLRRVWNLRTALTKADFEAARVPPTAGMAYDKLTATFGLLILNAISVPILLPFGLAYFIAQYNIDLYNMRRFKVSPANNKGVIPTMATRYTLLYIAGWLFLMAALFFTQNISSYYVLGNFFLVFGIITVAIYAFREFSTRVPIELHISALEHLDEKITIFAELDRLVPRLRTDSISASKVISAQHSRTGGGLDTDDGSGGDDDDDDDDDSDRNSIIMRRVKFKSTPSTRGRRLKQGTPSKKRRSLSKGKGNEAHKRESLQLKKEDNKLPGGLLDTPSVNEPNKISPQSKSSIDSVKADSLTTAKPEARMGDAPTKIDAIIASPSPSPSLLSSSPLPPSTSPPAAGLSSPSFLPPLSVIVSPPLRSPRSISRRHSDTSLLLPPPDQPLPINAALPTEAMQIKKQQHQETMKHPTKDTIDSSSSLNTTSGVTVMPPHRRSMSVTMQSLHPSSAVPTIASIDATPDAPTLSHSPPSPPQPPTSIDSTPPSPLIPARSFPKLVRTKSELPDLPPSRRHRRRPRGHDKPRHAHRESVLLFSVVAQQEFTHPHIHRPPLVHAHSHSHMVHAHLRHLSSVDQSICPDCLYRHPIFKKIEADSEVMSLLKAREEALLRQKEEELKFDQLKENDRPHDDTEEETSSDEELPNHERDATNRPTAAVPSDSPPDLTLSSQSQVNPLHTVTEAALPSSDSSSSTPPQSGSISSNLCVDRSFPVDGLETGPIDSSTNSDASACPPATSTSPINVDKNNSNSSTNTSNNIDKQPISAEVQSSSHSHSHASSPSSSPSQTKRILQQTDSSAARQL